MSEEIKKLKLMLEGKMPMQMMPMDAGSTKETVIYQTVGENK